jgi:hypothetical protein
MSYATWKFETTSITIKKAVCFHAVIKVIWEDFFEISTIKACKVNRNIKLKLKPKYVFFSIDINVFCLNYGNLQKNSYAIMPIVTSLVEEYREINSEKSNSK